MSTECMKISDQSRVISRRRPHGQRDMADHHNKSLNNMKMSTMQWGCSDFEISKVTYEWKIRHFSLRSEVVGRKLLSPMFYSGENREHEWVMEMYLGGIKNDVKDYVSLFLSLESCAETSVNVSLKISIINPKNNTKLVVHQTKHEMTEGALWGTNKFILRSTLNEHRDSVLIDDTLTIRCELQVYSDCKYTSEVDGLVAAGLNSSGRHLSQALAAATSMYSDVTIVVNGEEFKVHRFILASRSGLFAKMFASESSNESHSRMLVLNDVEPEVMSNMLWFMYTDNVRDETLALPLLAASKRYEFKYLEEISRGLVLQKLDESNVIDILVHAHTSNDCDLKRHAIDYILGHEMEIGKTDKFREFADGHAELLIEIYHARLSKLINKPEADETLYPCSQ